MQTYGLAVGGGYALAALPIPKGSKLQAENRNIFCLNRIQVKVRPGSGDAGRGFPKGAASIAGAIDTASLWPASFGTFLAGARKE